MAAAVHAAGMEPWDITMSDLITGRAQLDSFRGIIFVGESVSGVWSVCGASEAVCV
jgi:phosphoribosylformylglycinamidine (FGAM) synthase-like amidotransferase family enzyme